MVGFCVNFADFFVKIEKKSQLPIKFGNNFDGCVIK
jgi:hypothetical protein